MAWLEDISSALGIPAGATTLAAAMYAGCVAAEKVARPEALSEIGQILLHPPWITLERPADIIQKIFVWTFGPRHASWKCVLRSIFATAVLVSSISLTVYLKTGLNPLTRNVDLLIYDFFLIGIIPDYVALLKTRLIIAVSLPVIVLILVDLVLSVFISLIFFILFDSVYVIIHYGVGTVVGLWFMVSTAIKNNVIWMMAPNGLFMNPPVFLFSTLFTSIWTALIGISMLSLRLLAPIQLVTTWFFDVEHHPVRAIGVVGGGLTILCSLVWTITWKIF